MPEKKKIDTKILVGCALLIATLVVFYNVISSDKVSVTTGTVTSFSLLSGAENSGDETQSYSTDAKVNINAAGKEELMLMLPELTEQEVDGIIAYREKYGLFFTKEELLKVDGIGAATLEKIQDRIKLQK